jgi:uncharacterized membrane protein
VNLVLDWTFPLVRRLAPILALCLLATLALAVEGQSGTDLELGDVTYSSYDSDNDGLDDAVEVNATVHNGNQTRSRLYVLKVALTRQGTELDVRTSSGLLDPGGSASIKLRVGTQEDSPAGVFIVKVTLFVQELGGDIMGTDEATVTLRPLGDYELSLSSDATNVEAMENTSVTIKVTVTSTSNNPTGVNVTVTPHLGWNISLAPEGAVLEPGGSAELLLTVQVPPNEPPGTLETLDVEAVASRNSTGFTSLTLNVMVELQEFELELEVLQELAYVATGETVTVLGLVRNLGNNQDTATLMTQLPVDWSTEFHPPTLTLDRGTRGSFEMVLAAPSDLQGAGVLTINITARSKGLIVEATKELKVVYNTAELVVDAGNITFNPATPRAGEELTIQATVRNLGAVPVNNVEVHLRSDGKFEKKTELTTILVGGFSIASITWQPTPGDHFIQIVVDPEGTIGEVDDTNNVAGLSITVVSPELEVTQEDISLEPNYPREGTDAVLTVLVRNIGSLATGAFGVRLSVDDVVVENFTFDTGLLGDSNHTIQWTWSIPSGGGKHTVKVEVDPDGTVLEEDRTNNIATRRFTVNEMPVADLEASRVKAFINDQIAFDATGSFDPDGLVRQYFFDYGDGTDSGWIFTSRINHTYPSEGDYVVRLYVRDDVGAQNDDPATVEIAIEKKGSSKDKSPGPGVALTTLALVLVSLSAATARKARLVGRTGRR